MVCEGEESVRFWDRSGDEHHVHFVQFAMAMMLVVTATATATAVVMLAVGELVLVVAWHRGCCEVRSGI